MRESAFGFCEVWFWGHYAAKRKTSDQASVEDNPVALAIMKFIAEEKRWSGAIIDLNAALRNRYHHLTDAQKSFPRQVNRHSGVIRRLQPPLRWMGVSISFERHSHAGERILRIESV